MRYIMLACENIRGEILAALDEQGVDYPIIFIPQKYHLSPDSLREYLQSCIDSIDNVDAILLPMGLCGNGTLGIVSQKASIVLPNSSDCIDLLLSGDDIDRNRDVYSFYLTGSWLEGQTSIIEEYKHTLQKYGENRGKRILKSIYKNYQHFTMLDTGAYDTCEACTRIDHIADTVDMDVTVSKSPCGVLHKMLRLELDGNFITVPPGQTICSQHFTGAKANQALPSAGA